MGLSLTHRVEEGVRITEKKSGNKNYVRLKGISHDLNRVFLEVIVGGFPKHVSIRVRSRAEIFAKFYVQYSNNIGRRQARLDYQGPRNYFIERGKFIDGEFQTHLKKKYEE